MSSRSFALAVVTLATSTDIIAYSIAVPVLPDLGQKIGASPTMIGLLFASFGVTLLTVSIPMGAWSDRIGRKGPLIWGLVGLSAATLLFAFADSLTALFAARLAQGAADAVTWVVGFALLADIYEPSERGRATGIVMSGSSLAFMLGPSLGGWLYEIGGIRLPFVIVAIMSAIVGLASLGLRLPRHRAEPESVPALAVLFNPAVAACAAAVATIAATVSMLEPVWSLHLGALGINPGRVGTVFGVAALATALLHPLYGRLADYWGAQRLTLWGLALSGCVLPLLGGTGSFGFAIAAFTLQAATMALVITPSLAYMADATMSAGVALFGVAYGLYNVAWAMGLLGGPALGGFFYERIGLAWLTLGWGPSLVLIAGLLARAAARPHLLDSRPLLGGDG